MKVLFDTSVLVAGMVAGHSRHEAAFPWLRKALAKDGAYTPNFEEDEVTP